MNRRFTIDQSLQAWKEFAPLKNLGLHISTPDLYDLIMEEQRPDDTILNHLYQCQSCSRELKSLLESIEAEESWDIVLLKAASSEFKGPLTLTTSGGKYTITIKRNLSNMKIALMTLEVEAKNRDRMEDRVITVKDNEGSMLIKGKIINGKVSQKIHNIESLDISRLTILEDIMGDSE